jgi:tRNA threonylcarbamoyladenosine biosynthesis protein TsaB
MDALAEIGAQPRMLVLDTCGEVAGVCLCAGASILWTEELDRRAASATIIAALERGFEHMAWSLADLDLIGLVNGPGSFTGVRTGVATAKGISEAAALPLVSVSRLAVLADVSGLRTGFAVLDAGRSSGVFVRDIATGAEWVASAVEDIPEGDLAVAESRVQEMMSGRHAVLRLLRPEDAVPTILRAWYADGMAADAALVDANYVRGESDIYRKPAAT